MTPERWKRVAALFTAIAEDPTADEAEILDRLCGVGDSADRQEVERLLRANRANSGLFDRPASHLAGLPLPEQEPGDECRLDPRLGRVGDYRLLHPIGRSATSIVYLAVRDDDMFCQRVAIKLIRPEIDDPTALQRFNSERQILAGLEHPNIARLYGGGQTEDGRPYLAMEYVEGLSITDFCDRKALDLGSRLRLFLDICSAVQYAHQSLLVHRDLKPGNILVTTEGTVKLLDFGIAKALVPREGLEPRTTQTGRGPMTLSYASPEQIRGSRVTPATDVYALGVLLFELLTGSHPYRVSSNLPHEIALAKCEGRIDLPSRAFADSTRDGADLKLDKALARDSSPFELRRRLRGDLDNIVSRALHVRPERRYPSALQLAEDIRRHLANRPIHARQDHLGYRLGKFCSRNRTVVLLTCIACLLVGSLTLVVRRQADLLETSRFDTERVTEVFLERLVTSGSDPESSHPVPREALDASLTELAPRFGSNRQGLAEMLETMGWVYRRAGLTEDARWLFEQSLDERRLAGNVDGALASATLALGSLLVDIGEFETGELKLRQTITLEAESGDGETYIQAEALETLGMHRWSMGYLDEAEVLLRRSLAIKQTICPTAAWTAGGMSSLATLLLERDRPAEAEILIRAAAKLRNRFSSTHRSQPRTLEDQGVLEFAHGDLSRAEALFSEALEARRGSFGSDQREVITDLEWLARVVLLQGRSGEAVDLLRDAAAIHERLSLGAGPRFAGLLKLLGRALTEAEEIEAAESLLAEVIDLETRWYPTDHPSVAVSRLWLGKVLQARGAHLEAEKLYRLAARVLDSSPEWNFGLGLEPGFALAELYLDRARWADARAELDRVMTGARAHDLESHWRLLRAKELMRIASTEQGDESDEDLPWMVALTSSS